MRASVELVCDRTAVMRAMLIRYMREGSSLVKQKVVGKEGHG